MEIKRRIYMYEIYTKIENYEGYIKIIGRKDS